MKEAGQLAQAYTLEDRIRGNSSYMPTGEMLAGVSQARDIMQDCNLVGELGLTNQSDSMLLHAYIADRVIKTRLYDLEWLTHSPEFRFTAKQDVRNDLRRDGLQTSLVKLEEERDAIIGESYNGFRGRLRARNLELAANDLIARASVNVDDEKHAPYTDIEVSKELLSDWSSRWKGKFKVKKLYGARQKHLKFKRI